MKKGDKTRQKILDLAEAAVLAKGFAGTSIDSLIEEAGISKGGFFYHFRDKTDLIESLVRRYLQNDDRFFEDLFARADSLVEDPLQNYLLFLRLLAEAMADLPATHPGCMVASVCYQNQGFDRRISDLNRRGVEKWRRMFLARLRRIAEVYPLRSQVDLLVVADAMTSIIEGGIVLSRVFEEKDLLPEQILLHRDHIRLMFEAPGAGRAAGPARQSIAAPAH